MTALVELGVPPFRSINIPELRCVCAPHLNTPPLTQRNFFISTIAPTFLVRCCSRSPIRADSKTTGLVWWCKAAAASFPAPLPRTLPLISPTRVRSRNFARQRLMTPGEKPKNPKQRNGGLRERSRNSSTRHDLEVEQCPNNVAAVVSRSKS